MSGIKNRLIEKKLREVIDLNSDDDLSKFSDDSALMAIFNYYDAN